MPPGFRPRFRHGLLQIFHQKAGAPRKVFASFPDCWHDGQHPHPAPDVPVVPPGDVVGGVRGGVVSSSAGGRSAGAGRVAGPTVTGRG